MYLASFNHKGRDLIGVRRGADELLVLDATEAPRSAAPASTDIAPTDAMLALIMGGADSLAALARAGGCHVTSAMGMTEAPLGGVDARYKGTDGFAPLGPWLVTRDEVPNPGELDVICKVGTEVVAEDSTRYLTYSVPEILAFLSRFHTLEPGDVISMGTAFRQQAGAKRSLHSADLQRVAGPMQVEITGLGSLVTPVRRRQMELGDWQLPRS